MILAACTSVQAPEAVYPVPQPKQVAWQQMETYAFIHFGLNTFNDMEWGYGDTPAETFNPTNLDCEQWAKTCKAAGMKGIIFTAKHHDGFCLWPTEHTDYNISRSPYKDGKGDVVRELSQACGKYGLKFAVYLSPWDRHASTYGSEAYVEYYHLQLKELLSSYGDVFEFWFDGANGGNGWYGGANETRKIGEDYYHFGDVIKEVEALQPQAIIFSDAGPGCRWVGNENGIAEETNWAFLPDEKTWAAAECDVSIRPGWFYHEKEDSLVKTPEQLVDLYYKSVGRNATFLLNFPVNREGRIHPVDSANAVRYYQMVCRDFEDNLVDGASLSATNTRGRAFAAKFAGDGRYDSYWATEDGVTNASLTAEWDSPQRISRIMIQEYIPLGQRVQEFSVEYLLDGKWQVFPLEETTTTIGYKRLLRFAPVETTALRVNILKSRGAVCINEFGIY
ncbi:MAG: alpha-L-fucosidase [Bacteroidales bacterium]|nr:alpha-L-fucosidase [Bacteroidales bacterium]